MTINYPLEIAKIAKAQNQTGGRQNVLQTPLFVLLAGVHSQSWKQRLLQELQSRWTSAKPHIYLCDIDFHAHSANSEIHQNVFPTMLHIKMNLPDASSVQTKMAQLTLWFQENIARHGVENLRTLQNSRICVVLDSAASDLDWAARCCMILNKCLFDRGYAVDRRQLFCLLPQTASREGVKDKIKSWKTQIPDEKMFAVFANGKVSKMVSANDPYDAPTVFDQYVFLDEIDSSMNTVNAKERIHVLAQMMDPVCELQWPFDPTNQLGNCYSGWIYPRYAGREIDIALGWKCLNRRYQEDANNQNEPKPDFSGLFPQIARALKDIANAIPRQMTGFCIYREAVLDRVKGNSADMFRLEKDLFGDVLQNKFDYLWRRTLNRLDTARWDEAICEKLSSIHSVCALNNDSLLQINANDAHLDPAPIDNITVDKQPNLQEIILKIAVNCYRGKSNEKIDAYIKSYNEALLAKIRHTKERLQQAVQRSNDLNPQIINAQTPFQDVLKVDLKNPTDDIDARSAFLNAKIPDSLYEEYAQAMKIADDEKFEEAVLDCLAHLYAFLSDPANGIPPMEIPQRNRGDRILCRVLGGLPTNNTFAPIPNGVDKGLNCCLALIDLNNILALK